MSKRIVSVLLQDILEAIDKIEAYTFGLNEDHFYADTKTVDAVVRNLEIIGEAANNIPENFRLSNPSVEWRSIIGIRRRIIHEYFDVDLEILTVS